MTTLLWTDRASVTSPIILLNVRRIREGIWGLTEQRSSSSLGDEGDKLANRQCGGGIKDAKGN